MTFQKYQIFIVNRNELNSSVNEQKLKNNNDLFYALLIFDFLNFTNVRRQENLWQANELNAN